MNAVVTGGSKGIGKAIATLLAQNGCRTTLIARSELHLKEAVSDLNKVSSQKHDYLSVDLTDLEKINARDIPQLSHADILVNCAGITQASLLAATRVQLIESVIDTNLTASILMSRACLRGMIKRKSGSILNMSSVLGMRSLMGTSVYSASKAGLIAFTRSLAKEMSSKNIRVNCLCPSLVDTEMMNYVPHDLQRELGPILTTEQVAQEAFQLINGAGTGIIRSVGQNGWE